MRNLIRNSKLFITSLMVAFAVAACEKEDMKFLEETETSKPRPTRFTQNDTILYYDMTVEKPWHADETFINARRKYEQDRANIADNKGFSDIYAIFNFDVKPEDGRVDKRVILCYAEGIYALNHFLIYEYGKSAEKPFVTGGRSYYATQSESAQSKHWCTTTFKDKRIYEVDLYPKNIEANGATGEYIGLPLTVGFGDSWSRNFGMKINILRDIFYQPPVQ
ncbi:MAG: hypothetical protein LBK26_03130 [Rickettsiales bacterium]|jgi:hypothetical protein|nr:hypothetical protein [Rickettsiales bacterium]